MKERAREVKGGGAPRQGPRGWRGRPAGEDRRDAAAGPRPGRAALRDRHVERAHSCRRRGRHARVGRGRQDLCFFEPAAKFDARYATFGFNDTAALDAGVMWPTSWALTSMTVAEEKKIAALVKKGGALRSGARTSPWPTFSFPGD